MKQFRGNWNQNDSSADDYIKGRTHWEEIKTTVIIEERTISGFALMQDPLYAVENPFMFAPNVGDTYTVTWDGTAYDVVANDYGMVVIGNRNYFDMLPGGDIPFAIICNSNVLFVVTESTAGSHTISISAEIEKVHKLDKKYLPDDIASNSKLQKLEANIGSSFNDLYNEINQLKSPEFITIEDTSEKKLYALQIKHGEIVYTEKPTGTMYIGTNPTKTSYVKGEYFDPTGLVLAAIYGTEEKVTVKSVPEGEYTWEPKYFDQIGNIKVIFRCFEQEASVTVSVSEFDPAVELVDFDYTDNGDGTYTLTGWKGTLNGEPSTRMIIPDNALIKL